MYSEHEDSETKIVILRTHYAKPGKNNYVGHGGRKAEDVDGPNEGFIWTVTY